MSLIETLAAPPPARTTGGAGASIRKWVETLPEPEQAAIRQAALGTDWPHRALLTVLTDAGMPPVSDNTLREWRISVGWQA